MIPVKVNHSANSDKKPRKPRLHHSGWLITINTNVFWDCDNEECIELERKLKESVNNIASEENIPNLVEFLEPEASWTYGIIEGVNVESVIETDGGKNGNRLHLHLFIQIHHRTKLKLKYDTIKESFKQGLGRDKIYFNVKLLRSASSNLESIMSNYFKKYLK